MVELSERVRSALNSRATATNDFFGGWSEDDVEFLAGFAADPHDLSPEPGTLVDWLGGRTALENHAWLAAPPEGCVVADLPVPDDQVHAETIEYVAMLRSLERARARGTRFTMLELGASYAPWCVSAGLVADRLGFERIHLVAVEASRPAIDRIHDHVRLNGLADRGHVTWDIVHAAVSFRGGHLYFPRVDTRSDNGAQATRRRARSDYRGMRLEYDKVPAVTLPELTRSLDHVDYIHLDLQGAEEALLEDDGFLNCLSKRASAMLLATQSRLIEGLALRALPARGWRLVRERPTMFQQNDRTDDPNGWTVRDGAQYWTRG